MVERHTKEGVISAAVQHFMANRPENQAECRPCARHGNSLVAPRVEQVQHKLELGVDDPHEQEARRLQPRHRKRADVRVRQLAALCNDSVSPFIAQIFT